MFEQMKKVTCCEFCEFTDLNYFTVAKHECDCLFNPKNKTCLSCNLRDDCHNLDVVKNCSRWIARQVKFTREDILSNVFKLVHLQGAHPAFITGLQTQLSKDKEIISVHYSTEYTTNCSIPHHIIKKALR